MMHQYYVCFFNMWFDIRVQKRPNPALILCSSFLQLWAWPECVVTYLVDLFFQWKISSVHMPTSPDRHQNPDLVQNTSLLTPLHPYTDSPTHALSPPSMTQRTPPLQLPPLQNLLPIPRPDPRQESMPPLPHSVAWVIRIPRPIAYLYGSEGRMRRNSREEVEERLCHGLIGV